MESDDMQFSYPFRIDEKGHTAKVEEEEEHVHQLIEQVLFTIQGERVNRPTFGTNINQLVFAPNSDELATATQVLVQGALQQWLGDLINVESVKVGSEESTLRAIVEYSIRRSQERRTQTFTREI
ncbi:MAG: GPW/gp25 family protein [Thermodesulfobacteriota bacterium]